MSHATYGMKNSALVMHPHANIGMFVRAVVVSIGRMYAHMQGQQYLNCHTGHIPKSTCFWAFLPLTSILIYAAAFSPSLFTPPSIPKMLDPLDLCWGLLKNDSDHIHILTALSGTVDTRAAQLRALNPSWDVY